MLLIEGRCLMLPTRHCIPSYFYNRALVCFVLSLCSWFISSEKKNVVYGFLMSRYLIKIPVHLPRLRSMSHAGPLWWHHTVVEAFPLGRLADLCLCYTTPSLHPHSAHILANTYLLLSTGNFQEGFGLFIPALSTRSHFFSSLLCISHGGLQVAMTFWTVRVRDLEPPVIFLYETLTQAVFFPLYFCHVSPPSSLSKSRLEPVRGLMRLEFIRQWVGTAPRSPLTADCWLSFWGNKTLVI